MRAVVIEVDGQVREFDFGEDGQLEILQTNVGGDIEAVYLKPDEVMWINEDGKGLRLPRNEVATFIAHAGTSIFPNDYIAGPAILTSMDEDGETREAKPWMLAMLNGTSVEESPWVQEMIGEH